MILEVQLFSCRCSRQNRCVILAVFASGCFSLASRVTLATLVDDVFLLLQAEALQMEIEKMQRKKDVLTRQINQGQQVKGNKNVMCLRVCVCKGVCVCVCAYVCACVCV